MFITFPQAYSSTSAAKFCQDYSQNQLRIAEVKADGWQVKQDPEYRGNAEYLYGCLDLKWREELYSNLCLHKKTQINLPKAILFYFDGFGYFKPKEAKNEFHAINLTGNEPAGMIPNGYHALDMYISGIKNYINWDKDVQFHYHSGSGTDAIQGIENAQVCYATMEDDLKIIEEKFPEITMPKKIIMGHSNGGINAINFVNYFTEKNDSKFDLLFTIDPVSKVGSLLKNKIFSRQASLAITKKENIARSVNLYQTSDRAVLAGVMSLKGNSVEGVDIDKNVDYVDHVTILLDRFVVKTVVNEVSITIKK